MNSEPMNPNHFEDLIVGHFGGSLTGEQESKLAEALATSAEAKQFFLSYMRMEGRLHSLGRDGFLREPVEESALATERPAAQPVDDAVRSAKSQRLRLIAASTSLAVCTFVILMLTTGVLWPATASANSVLKEAKHAAAELVDRAYRLTLTDSDEKGTRRPREYAVTARGGGRFVIQPGDGGYVMGSDGTDYWMARPQGPVWVTSDFRSLVPELQRKIPDRHLLNLVDSPVEPLLMEMSALLAHIEHRYDIELVDSDNDAEHHVTATLQKGRRNRPTAIDFWADADSGVVLRAEIEWSRDRHMQFELVESAMLSDRWYHCSEHAPGREVERLDALSSR